MKTKNIIILILVMLVGLFSWGYFIGSETPSSVQIVSTFGNSQIGLIAPEISYDFGTISMKKGNVVKEFSISNPTYSDITLSKVSTSCMCTQAFIVNPTGSVKGPFGMVGHGSSVPRADEIIKAGESRIIRVVYDPNAHGPAGVGKINRFVTLTDSFGNTLQFEIKAMVTP